jgi:hypothetical protein
MKLEDLWGSKRVQFGIGDLWDSKGSFKWK